MDRLKYSLLVAIFCAVYWRDSVSQTETLGKHTESSTSINLKDDVKGVEGTGTGSTLGSTLAPLSTEELLPELQSLDFERVNSSETSTANAIDGSNLNASLAKLDRKVQTIEFNQKQSADNSNNTAFNDIKPFLLFPFLPLLFPTENDETASHNLVKKDSLTSSNAENSSADVKPFIFFDLAFNIRQIPTNLSDSAFDSNENGKKVSFFDPLVDDLNKDLKKPQNKRKSDQEKDNFFDGFSLFQNSEIDDFFPKLDLLFPDLPFRHKPFSNLSRRKRDMKKPNSNNGINFFLDAFDEALMRTKRELEEADPIANFFKGPDSPFDDKKEKKFFLPGLSKRNAPENPGLNWEIQRNVKRLNKNPEADVVKVSDSPLIIVDKVFKIGQFRFRDDGQDKTWKKKKKRDLKKRKNKRDMNRKSLDDDDDDDNHDEATVQRREETDERDEANRKNILEMMKERKAKDNSMRKKRHSFPSSEGKTITKIQSKVIRIMPRLNISFLTFGENGTIKIQRSVSGVNLTENTDKRRETDKKGEFVDLTNAKNVSAKKPEYEDLKKNITQVLNKFLVLLKKMDDPKQAGKTEEEGEDAESFDWTENETLNRKEHLKRQKKDAYVVDVKGEERKKSERQMADLNYLFLTVTLPTIVIFALLLLVCFFSLQVKGKICTKLFKPRQVLLVDDEITGKTTKKIQKGKNLPFAVTEREC